MRGIRIGYHVAHAFSARCQVRVERARRAPRATAAEAHTTVPQPWPWPPIIVFRTWYLVDLGTLYNSYV